VERSKAGDKLSITRFQKMAHRRKDRTTETNE